MNDDKAHFVTYNVHTCNCGWQGDNIRVHFRDVEEARKRSEDMGNESFSKYFIIINEYSRASVVKAATAKDAVLAYETAHLHKVRQVMMQPTIAGNHVDVQTVEHTVILR